MGVLSKAAAAAARSGSVKALKAALEISESVCDRDENSETLLMIAASAGHIAACMFLYDMGADLRSADQLGRTAYERAKVGGHTDLVKWFEAISDVAAAKPVAAAPAAAITAPAQIADKTPKSKGKSKAGSNEGSKILAMPERCPAALPEERQSQLKQLIALGKEQGYLTYSQMNDFLPTEIVDPDQIEEIGNTLQEMGIPLYEKAPENDALLAPETRAPADDEAIEEAAAALGAIDAELRAPATSAPADDEVIEEAVSQLAKSLKALPENLRRVIELRFGIFGFKLHDLFEVAKELGVEFSDACAAETEALRLLRADLDRSSDSSISVQRLQNKLDEQTTQETYLLSEVLKSIADQRHREILKCRMGFESAKRETLESIGIRLGLTRERVRQIEKAAISKIRKRWKSDERITHLVAHIIPRKAFLKTGYFAHDELTSALRKNLSVSDEFFVLLQYASFNDWLNAVSTVVEGGWIPANVSHVEFESAAKLLQSYAVRSLLPQPSAILFSDQVLTRGALRSAIDSSKNFSICDGFVCNGPAGVRTRRLCQVIRLMSRGQEFRQYSGAELGHEYAKAAYGPLSSKRDINIVLSEARHLVIALAGDRWVLFPEIRTALRSDEYVFSIDRTRIVDMPDCKVREQDDEIDKQSNVQDGLARVISETLSHFGVLGLGRLRYEVKKNYPDTYAPSSIGAVLMTNSEFIRLAPGVYANEADYNMGLVPEGELDKLLLTERQLEMYCDAVEAGESRQLFPAWNFPLERKWACWALENDFLRLLDRLLAIGTLELWGLSECDFSWWTARRSRAEIYLDNEVPGLDVDDDTLTAESLLKVAAHAAGNGGISWISVNQAMGRRINDGRSAVVLCALSLLGFVTAPQRWKDRHILKDNALKGIKEFCEAARRNCNGALRDIMTLPPTTGSPDGWLLRASAEQVRVALDHGRCVTSEARIIESKYLRDPVVAPSGTFTIKS